MNFKKLTLLACLLMGAPIAMFGQTSGIKFVSGLSWNEIKAKAKAENKYIFLDCMATWCGPCHQMDNVVFPNDSVGHFLNIHFISAKVQMDITKFDGDAIKKWYADSKNLGKNYQINAFPTFLFFSPDGNLVHRGVGFYPVTDFLILASDAMDPSRQYYKLISAYRGGVLPFNQVLLAAKGAKQFGTKSLADSLLTFYRVNYLDVISEKQFRSKEILSLLDDFPELFYQQGTKSRYFSWLYYNPKQADSLTDIPIAEFYVKQIITVEEINKQIYKDKKPVSGTPDWEKIRVTIHQKYPKVDDNLYVLDSQILFYRSRRDGPSIIKYFVEKTKKYGVDSTGFAGMSAGNTLGDIFLPYCNDKDTLKLAIKWMEHHLHTFNQFADTSGNNDLTIYAGLLYKMGRKNEAITWMQKEVQMLKKQARNHPTDDAISKFLAAKYAILKRFRNGDHIDSTWNVGDFH